VPKYSPRVSLGTWPTPIEPAPRLAVAIGLGPDDLWIKRDDLTGLGGGGNKVRKLEYLCGRALALGADTLVTSGAAQSNHARLTAAAGARLGLEVHLVLRGHEGSKLLGNLLLDRLFDATLHWAGDVDEVGLTRHAQEVGAALTGSGRNVDVVPYGGSNATSIQGYVDCAEELLTQVPDLERVVVAVGSGGTMAGLLHGLGTDRVLGVDTGAISDPENTIASFLGELGTQGAVRLQLQIRSDQVGSGYSELTGQVRAALNLAARMEGLVLDPVYTGRALAGLIASVQDGSVRKGETTIFLHSGGLPGLFGHPEASELTL